MSISYHVATPNDAHDLARIQIEAFMQDKFYQFAFRLTDASKTEEVQENIDYRIRRYGRQLKNPHIHYIKAVDNSAGEVVGLSGWQEPKNRQSDGAGVGDELERPAGWNHEFVSKYEMLLEEEHRRLLGDADSLWYVRMVAVLPAYRGRGVALTLIKRGLELVDHAGEDVFLEATPVAVKLYEQQGFARIGDLEIPDGYHMPIMLRRSPK